MNKPAKIFFYLTCLVFFSEISMGTPVPTKIQAVNENSLQNRLLDGSVPSNFSSEKQVDKINLNELLSLPFENLMDIARTKSSEIGPLLIEASQNSQFDMNRRWKAFMVAAEVAPVQLMGNLQVFLKSNEWYLRNAALVVADKMAPERAYGIAKELIKDRALVVRSAAVDILAKNLRNEDRDLLWAEFNNSKNRHKNKNLWIKGQIALILARNPLAREKKNFQLMLKEADLKAQVASIKALEKIYDKKLGQDSDSVANKIQQWQKYSQSEGIQNPGKAQSVVQ